MNTLQALITVSRPQYLLVGYLFAVSYSAFACGSWVRLLANRDIILLGALLGGISHLLGSQINCLADVAIDRHHKHKCSLAAAVERLGARGLWTAFVVESIIALGLTIIIVIVVGKPWLLGIWLTGWVLAVAYSLEPIRLKRRGFLNPISLVTIIYFLPFSFGYQALNDRIDVGSLPLMTAIGLQLFGLFLMNEVEDVPEDRSQYVLTPCVKYGVRNMTVLALSLFLAASLVALSGFVRAVDQAGLSFILVVGYVVGIGRIIADQAAILALGPINNDPDEGLVNGDTTVASLRRLASRNKWHFLIVGVLNGTGAIIMMF